MTVFSLGQAYGWEHSIIQAHFLVIKFEKVEIEHPLSKFAVVALFPWNKYKWAITLFAPLTTPRAKENWKRGQLLKHVLKTVDVSSLCCYFKIV